MQISCQALEGQNPSLPFADISASLLIELVEVTASWEPYARTNQGTAVPLRDAKVGQRIRMSFQNDKLERVDKEGMDTTTGIWQSTAISQAIRDNPQIGRIWIIR